MRTIALLGTACAAAIGALCVVQSHAADLGAIYPAPPTYAEPDAQFEFGTGWYLRGDASFADEVRPALDLNAQAFSKTKQDWNYVLGGGVGYKFNSFLRADVTGDWFSTNDLNAQAPNDPRNPAQAFNRAKIQKYDGLANLYIDLGNWYGVTPYVGGGAGFSVFDPSESISAQSRAIDAVAGGANSYSRDNLSTKTKFAWAAMAGVSYQIAANTSIDLGYRHLDLGRFSTTLVGYQIDHHYTEDQIRIGLRYMIF